MARHVVLLAVLLLASLRVGFGGLVFPEHDLPDLPRCTRSFAKGAFADAGKEDLTSFNATLVNFNRSEEELRDFCAGDGSANSTVKEWTTGKIIPVR